MYFLEHFTQQELCSLAPLCSLLTKGGDNASAQRCLFSLGLKNAETAKVNRHGKPISLFFLSSEYYPIVMVPAGARSIRVQEMEISTSYLAVRSLKRGTYYLTGDWTVDWPGRFQFAGTTFNYQRSFNRPETLYATGPTNETLLFEVSDPRPRLA